MPKKAESTNAESVIEFGERSVNAQNFSRVVTLPKEALRNCGCNLEDDAESIKVKVDLVKNNKESFIKLTPICRSNNNDKKKKMEDEE